MSPCLLQAHWHTHTQCHCEILIMITNCNCVSDDAVSTDPDRERVHPRSAPRCSRCLTRVAKSAAALDHVHGPALAVPTCNASSMALAWMTIKFSREDSPLVQTIALEWIPTTLARSRAGRAGLGAGTHLQPKRSPPWTHGRTSTGEASAAPGYHRATWRELEA